MCHVWTPFRCESQKKGRPYLLKHSGCRHALAHLFSLRGYTFHLVESLSRNRKSDVLFTGLSAWEVSDCIFFCWWPVALLGHQAFLLRLVLFWLDIYADLFTPSVHGVEALTHWLLCLAAVWLSGLSFLPLLDYTWWFWEVSVFTLSLYWCLSFVTGYFSCCTVLFPSVWHPIAYDCICNSVTVKESLLKPLRW